MAAVQKDANLVELEKCCQTHIFLQNFVLIQPRTSPPKICKNFANFFSILLTLTPIAAQALPLAGRGGRAPGRRPGRGGRARRRPRRRARPLGRGRRRAPGPTTRRVVARFWQNFGKMLLVFGCIGTDFCKKICVLQHFSKSNRFSS